jgi:hypothetical protein
MSHTWSDNVGQHRPLPIVKLPVGSDRAPADIRVRANRRIACGACRRRRICGPSCPPHSAVPIAWALLRPRVAGGQPPDYSLRALHPGLTAASVPCPRGESVIFWTRGFAWDRPRHQWTPAVATDASRARPAARSHAPRADSCGQMCLPDDLQSRCGRVLAARARPSKRLAA